MKIQYILLATSLIFPLESNTMEQKNPPAKKGVRNFLESDFEWKQSDGGTGLEAFKAHQRAKIDTMMAQLEEEVEAELEKKQQADSKKN